MTTPGDRMCRPPWEGLQRPQIAAFATPLPMYGRHVLGRINGDLEIAAGAWFSPAIKLFMSLNAAMLRYCGIMAPIVEGAVTRARDSARPAAGFPRRHALGVSSNAAHACARSMWTAALPWLPHLAPYLCTIPLIARFKMTKRDGAVVRNEVFGRANRDRLLAKDVVRALGLIFRTRRCLELPYLYALTYFLCIVPLVTGTRVPGYRYPGTRVPGYPYPGTGTRMYPGT